MWPTNFTQLFDPKTTGRNAWVVSSELAAAVSEAGGPGMISGVRRSPEKPAEFISSVSRRTTKPIGVNLLMPFLDRECVAVAASNTRVVEFFYGPPDHTSIEAGRRHGARVSWQVGSVEEAVAPEEAGCDFIIALGIEAGGHIRGLVGLRPLLSAGGIGTARQIRAVLAAGAAGARIGTRFIACTESGAHPAYIQALIRARAEDTVITETFSATWPHAPHRVLRSCVEAANSFEGDTVAEAEHGQAMLKIPRFGSFVPTRSTIGRIESMALYAGQSCTAVRKVQSAIQLNKELTS